MGTAKKTNKTAKGAAGDKPVAPVAPATDERDGLPSASSMDADIRCLGRRNICATVPKEPSSKAAQRGQAIHKVLEGVAQLDSLTKSDQITAQRIMHEEARLVEKYHFEGAKIFVETRMWVVNDDMERMFSGQVDRAHVIDERAFVPDYKTGWSKTVPITENWQVRTQAVLVQYHHAVSEVVAALIHPHHPDSLSEVIVYQEKDLQQFYKELYGFIDQMNKPDAQRTPNDISCEYCAAKSICPEFQKTVSEFLPDTPVQIIRPKYELFSPAQAGQRLRMFKLVEKVMKEEKAYYEAQLAKNPLAVEGYKLQASEMRVILDDVAAFNRLKQAIGEGNAEKCMAVSMSALEETLKNIGVKDEEMRGKIAEILGDQLQFKAKKPSLREA